MHKYSSSEFKVFVYGFFELDFISSPMLFVSIQRYALCNEDLLPAHRATIHSNELISSDQRSNLFTVFKLVSSYFAYHIAVSVVTK